MIRVVIFDLGRTLIDSTNQPFAHVKEALTAISSSQRPAAHHYAHVSFLISERRRRP